MFNRQVYITSLTRAVQRAKKTGKFNLKIISLYRLYTYYIEWIESLNTTTFNEQLVYFKKEAAKLQFKYPKEICDYKVIIPNDPIKTTTPSSTPNTAPTVSDNCVNITTETSYMFKVQDFTLNYADAEGHGWKYVMVYPEETGNGAIYSKSGNPLPPAIVVNIEGKMGTDSTGITYTRNNSGTYSNDTFSFRISDNPSDFLYSAIHTICINATESTVENLPVPDVGDRTVYVDNRAVTVFTLFDFVGGLEAPWNDPEGDLIDAIRIIDISNANDGKFYLNGVEIIEGQIITREDIQAGLFTHEAADTDAIQSDVFEFEARDEGSQIWVG